MVDPGIKKARISYDNLPPINVNEEGYIVRYRVVSEDKNRTSHWSPINIIKPEYTYTLGSIDFNKSGSLATIAWDAVQLNKDSNVVKTINEYDIWVKWHRSDNGDWIYQGRITGTSITLLIPTTYKIGGVVQVDAPNRLNVEVFLKGNPVTRDTTFLRVYQDGPHTV